MNARLTLTAVCVVVFMLLLDMTIVAAALSDIQSSFHAPLTGLQWVVDAYALPMAGLLLTAATVGDRLGRRRLYLGGLVVFMFASAGCALARNIDVLNGLRAVQGSAGAVLLGVSLPMIAAAFPDVRHRAGAIAAYGAAMGAGGATCFASGFAESEAEGAGGEAAALELRAAAVAGVLAVLGMANLRRERPYTHTP